MGRAVSRSRTSALVPGITCESLNGVQFPLRQHFSRIHLRAPDDERERAFTLRRLPDMWQTFRKRFQSLRFGRISGGESHRDAFVGNGSVAERIHAWG